jgi:hypothetical protein
MTWVEQHARLGSAIPALPVRAVGAAVDHYTTRFGFTCRHQDAGFGIVVRDDVELHLWESGDDGWRSRPAADLFDSPVRTGAETFIAGTASCRIQVDVVDALYAELSAAGVLHPTDGGSPVDTDYGTREFATSDLDGNLLTFYQRS